VALTAASYNVGQWYRVRAELYRSGGGGTGGTGVVYYIYLGATASASDFTDMGTLTVGQKVYGDTYAQPTAMTNLSWNDKSIVRRLKRRDYAIQAHDESYRFTRRYDTLYYNGSNLELAYGTRTLTLDDLEDHGKLWMLILDALGELHHLPHLGLVDQGPGSLRLRRGERSPVPPSCK